MMTSLMFPNTFARTVTADTTAVRISSVVKVVFTAVMAAVTLRVVGRDATISVSGMGGDNGCSKSLQGAHV